MKCFLLTILSIYFTNTSFCQNAVPEFGRADLEELLMKDCEFEKGAPALTLYKFEKTELVNENMTIKTERRERIKIFNSSGYPYANIEIPFSKRNKIKDLSAIIYNLDEAGRLTTHTIEKDEIYKQSSKKKKGTLVFTFPELKPGSVIEFKFTEVEIDASIYDVKFFQTKIPVQLCVFKIVAPDYMKAELSYTGENENKEELLERKTPSSFRNTFTISRKNILSFRTEPFMSSANDNLQRFISKFVYSTAWKDSLIAKAQNKNNIPWSFLNSRLVYHPFFGEQFKVLIKGTEAIIDTAKKIQDKAILVDFIFRHVKNKIKWNDEELIYAIDINNAWKSGTGSSAEINLTILNLLRKSGVECYPVLIRSREYGKINRTFYSLGQFNNVNVLVAESSNYYVLDGTKKYLSYQTPPYEILNSDVLLIDADHSQWLTISDTRPLLKNNISVKAEIDSVGNISGDAFVSYFDFLKEHLLIEKENKAEEAQEVADINFLKKNSADIKIDSLTEENANNDLQPLNHSFRFSYKPEFTVGYLFIDPFFLSSFRKNPFSDSIRRTDIDLGCNQYYNINLHLILPENFTIESLPKNTIIIANDSSMIFKRQTLHEGKVLVFRHSFEIKRTIFSKEEYPSIREYFRKIYIAIQDQLILKKK